MASGGLASIKLPDPCGDAERKKKVAKNRNILSMSFYEVGKANH